MKYVCLRPRGERQQLAKQAFHHEHALPPGLPSTLSMPAALWCLQTGR